MLFEARWLEDEWFKHWIKNRNDTVDVSSQMKLNNAMLSSVLWDYSDVYILVKVIEQGANNAVIAEDKNNEEVIFKN